MDVLAMTDLLIDHAGDQEQAPPQRKAPVRPWPGHRPTPTAMPSSWISGRYPGPDNAAPCQQLTEPRPGRFAGKGRTPSLLQGVERGTFRGHDGAMGPGAVAKQPCQIDRVRR